MKGNRASLAWGVIASFLAACSSSGSDPNNNSPSQSGDPDSTITSDGCANVIEDQSFSSAVTLANTDSACDYYIKGFAQFESAITIEAGAVILFASDAEFSVLQGQLQAVGSPSQRITFMGEFPRQGFWQGIYLNNLRESRLEHVDIVDGGNNSPAISDLKGGLVIEESIVSIVDVSVSNSFVRGARIDSKTQLTEFRNNRFFGNALEGLNIAKVHINSLDSSSDYVGEQIENGLPHIEIINGGDYPRGVNTWRNLNAPYVTTFLIAGDDEDIQIEAGVKVSVEFYMGAELGGSLSLRGSPAQPISVKGSTNDSGDWLGISASRNSTVMIDHAIIENAERGLFLDRDATARVSNTLFQNNETWGIDCINVVVLGEPPVLELGNGLSFVNNGNGDINPDCPM